MPAAETTLSSASAMGINVGAYVITGSIVGMQLDCLIAGLIGGAIALSFQKEMVTRSRMIAMVLTSGVLAGYGASVIDAVLHSVFSQLNGASSSTLFVAVLTGIGANTFVPAVFKFVKNFGDDGLISSIPKILKSVLTFFRSK